MFKITHYLKTPYEISTTERIERIDAPLASILLQFGIPLWEAKPRTALFHWISLLPLGFYFLIDPLFLTSYWTIALAFVVCRLFYTMQFRYLLTETHILRVNKLFKTIDAIELTSLLPLNEYSSFATHDGILNYKNTVVVKKSNRAPKEKIVGLCFVIYHLLPCICDVCVFRKLSVQDVARNKPTSMKYFYNLSKEDYKTYKAALNGVLTRHLSKTMTPAQIEKWMQREEKDQKTRFILHLIFFIIALIVFSISFSRIHKAFSSHEIPMIEEDQTPLGK